MAGTKILNPPMATRQITFHELLLIARQKWLIDALNATLAEVDPLIVKVQISEIVPEDVQRILAGLGIRDEHIFPTIVVLETRPSLVGYYRLLTGVGQKSFYRGQTGMAPFSRMENFGILTPTTRDLLPQFCASMTQVLAELVRATAPTLSTRDIHELQLLTLGSNFYGSINNTIGASAIQGILRAIEEILSEYVIGKTQQAMQIENVHGAMFSVRQSSDPDIAIEETTSDPAVRLLAIEVKGGADSANAYNRGGEAEKSHQGAKEQGFVECWTIIHMATVDQLKLQRGSPSTDLWFDTAHILAKKGESWDSFQHHLRRVVRLEK